jgi:catechol 2,3-dioxygenase-like lactoylglutathione lyase family enzyme
MIHGAHVILFSKDADADRAFFRDVLKYRFADAGHGWQIFALPPAEVACHPTDGEGGHELYLMCDDVQALIADMNGKGVATTPVHEERWGLLTRITLPSGGTLGVYEPRHPSPLDLRKAAPKKRRAAKKKAAPRKATAKKVKKAKKRAR